MARHWLEWVYPSSSKEKTKNHYDKTPVITLTKKNLNTLQKDTIEWYLSYLRTPKVELTEKRMNKLWELIPRKLNNGEKKYLKKRINNLSKPITQKEIDWLKGIDEVKKIDVEQNSAYEISYKEGLNSEQVKALGAVTKIFIPLIEQQWTENWGKINSRNIFENILFKVQKWGKWKWFVFINKNLLDKWDTFFKTPWTNQDPKEVFVFEIKQNTRTIISMGISKDQIDTALWAKKITSIESNVKRLAIWITIDNNTTNPFRSLVITY